MARRAHRALILAALGAALPRIATAQRPDTTAARDTLAPQLVFNDVFEVGTAIPPRLALEDGMVYRIEVEPGSATLTIRSARHPSLPPLLLIPLESAGAATQRSAYLLVPRSSEEYRIDVSAGPNEPVRIMIWTDPREMSRWARMRRATQGLPTAGLGVSFVSLGPFVYALSGAVAPKVSRAAATGVEACLAVVPRGSWLTGPVGGCVLTLARYSREAAGSLIAIGTEPRLEVSEARSAVEVSVYANTSIANDPDSQGADYWLVGGGVELAMPLLTSGSLYLSAEAGIEHVEPLGSGLIYASGNATAARLAIGLQLRF